MSANESWCAYCSKMIDARGLAGHVTSNVHRDNGGPSTVELTFPAAPPPDRDSEEAKAIINTALTAGLTESEVAELLAENAQLKARALRAEAAAERLAPFIERPMFETPADVRKFYGEDHMSLIGEVRLAGENKRRAKEGMPPLYTDPVAFAARVEEEAAKAATEMVADQTRWAPARALARGEHPKLRVLKMVKPALHECPDAKDGLCYTHASTWQLPLEPQINNGAGSLNDPIERYKRKGDKLLTPLRCHLVDCWQLSATLADGSLAFNGYCSALHHDYMEGRVTHAESRPSMLTGV